MPEFHDLIIEVCTGFYDAPCIGITIPHTRIRIVMPLDAAETLGDAIVAKVREAERHASETGDGAS